MIRAILILHDCGSCLFHKVFRTSGVDEEASPYVAYVSALANLAREFDGGLEQARIFFGDSRLDMFKSMDSWLVVVSEKSVDNEVLTRRVEKIFKKLFIDPIKIPDLNDLWDNGVDMVEGDIELIDIIEAPELDEFNKMINITVNRRTNRPHQKRHFGYAWDQRDATLFQHLTHPVSTVVLSRAGVPLFQHLMIPMQTSVVLSCAMLSAITDMGIELNYGEIFAFELQQIRIFCQTTDRIIVMTIDSLMEEPPADQTWTLNLMIANEFLLTFGPDVHRESRPNAEFQRFTSTVERHFSKDIVDSFRPLATDFDSVLSFSDAGDGETLPTEVDIDEALAELNF